MFDAYIKKDTTTLNSVLNNTQKREVISKLSPHYDVAEISDMTGVPENSVKYYRKKYNLPTQRDTSRLIRSLIEQEYQTRAHFDRQQALEEVKQVMGD